MQEMMLEDQMRAQLSLQEQGMPQNNRKPRRVKKTPKPLLSTEEVSESLKNEIEMLPMKTPISILQELLSRRGNDLIFLQVKNFIDFSFRLTNISLMSVILIPYLKLSLLPF